MAEQKGLEWNGVERRSGEDRRSGLERRLESAGVRNAFLFSLFFDRRVEGDRRATVRRRSEARQATLRN